MRRQVADAAYAVLVRAMFTQLERAATPDVKHGDRLRLENYSLLETELRPLAARVSSCILSPLFKEQQQQQQHLQDVAVVDNVCSAQ